MEVTDGALDSDISAAAQVTHYLGHCPGGWEQKP